MARAVQRPAARRDFIIHYVYLAENAGLDVAKQFRDAVESAYVQLAEMPRMGAPVKVRQENMPASAFGASANLKSISSLTNRAGAALVSNESSTPNRTIVEFSSRASC